MRDNIRRTLFDFAIFVSLIVVYATEFYSNLSQPLQLVFLKALLVSMGFLHAHITRKLAFGNIEWGERFTPKSILAILLYAVIIYAYATGG